MEKILKEFIVESKVVDAEKGIFEAMISTEQQDQVGDIVRASGAQIGNFMRNPVIPFAHQYDELPVAKALSLEIIPGVGIKSQFQFPPWGVSDKADSVHRLWAGGFLNAMSIGFSPIVYEHIESVGDGYRSPLDFKEWELLEYSICVVPMNAGALRLAMSTLEEPPIGKRGRVLSSANETKIKNAAGLLQDVLDQLANATEQESLPGEAPAPLDTEYEKANPNTDQTPHDEDDALALELEKILNIFKEKQNG